MSDPQMKHSADSTDQFRFIPSLTNSQLPGKAPAFHKPKLGFMETMIKVAAPSKSYVLICYGK